MSAWAQSRAVAARMVSDGLGGRGFESLQRRLPRSKVYGIGFETVTELLDILSIILRAKQHSEWAISLRDVRLGGNIC